MGIKFEQLLLHDNFYLSHMRFSLTMFINNEDNSHDWMLLNVRNCIPSIQALQHQKKPHLNFSMPKRFSYVFFHNCFVQIVFERGKSMILTYAILICVDLIGTVGFCWRPANSQWCCFLFLNIQPSFSFNVIMLSLFFMTNWKRLYWTWRWHSLANGETKLLALIWQFRKVSVIIDTGLLLTILHLPPSYFMLYHGKKLPVHELTFIISQQSAVTLPCRDGIFTPIYTLWRPADTPTINSSYIPANDCELDCVWFEVDVPTLNTSRLALSEQ